MPRFEDLAAEGQALVEVGGAVVGVDVATQAALTGHATDTTDVHGIADTSLLETTTGAQAKADAAEAAANTYTDNATSLLTAAVGTVRPPGSDITAGNVLLIDRLYLCGIIEVGKARAITGIVGDISAAGDGAAVIRFGVAPLNDEGAVVGQPLTELGSINGTSATTQTLSGLTHPVPAGTRLAVFAVTNGETATAPSVYGHRPILDGVNVFTNTTATRNNVPISAASYGAEMPATVPSLGGAAARSPSVGVILANP